MPTPLDLPMSEFVSLRAGGSPHLLVDCREPWEYELVHLPEAQLIPLAELADFSGQLPRDRPVVVYCHHGVRSRNGALLLRARGVLAAQSLAGGIDRYSLAVDPSLPRY